MAVQGELLMVAMQLMLGGSLRVALADPKLQDQLRWSNRRDAVTGVTRPSRMRRMCILLTACGEAGGMQSATGHCPPYHAPLRLLLSSHHPRSGRRVAVDVAEAVAYLHCEMRILHSDIKRVGARGGGPGILRCAGHRAVAHRHNMEPCSRLRGAAGCRLCRSANVLLGQDWRASLTDLGVAQVMENTARTAAGGSNLYAGGWAGGGFVRMPRVQCVPLLCSCCRPCRAAHPGLMHACHPSAGRMRVAAALQAVGTIASAWSCPWRRALKAEWPWMRTCLACWAGTAAWTLSAWVPGRWGGGWQSARGVAWTPG